MTETLRQSINVTWGLRYYEGYFYAHLMWMHWNTKQWQASRSLIRKRYRTLEQAIKSLESANGVDSVVMIFPV